MTPLELKPMRNLFFDVETTGKPLKGVPPGHPSQPHVVQLAALLVDDIHGEMASLAVIVRPDGFSIPVEASAIHGITDVIAGTYGVGISGVLEMFFALSICAEGFVAHNIDFDRFVITSELMRSGIPSCFVPGKPLYCTMKASTSVCRLPGPYGYKWPKLAEVYRIAFGEDLKGAHDALADVRACARVYKWLIDGHPVAGAQPPYVGPGETPQKNSEVLISERVNTALEVVAA